MPADPTARSPQFGRRPGSAELHDMMLPDGLADRVLAPDALAVLAQYIDAPADADHALITCDLTAIY